LEYNKKEQYRKRYFFLISIVIHIILLILLLFVYKYSQKNDRLNKKKKPAKIIFKKPQPKPKPPPPKPKPKPKPKAQPNKMPAYQGLKPLQKLQPPKPKPEPKKQEPKITKDEIKQPVDKKPIIKKDTNKNITVKKPEEKIKKQENPPIKKQPKPIQKPKPPKKKLTLADITKGFSDYTQKQGINLVQYVNSAKGVPTDEQIKRERYTRKLFDCFDILMKIKRNTLVLTQKVSPNHLFKITVNYVINKNGSLHYIKVLKTSGIHEVDNFIVDLIKEASSSFPPVPSYLSKDKFIEFTQFCVHAGSMINMPTPHYSYNRSSRGSFR